jgi:anti-sigma B factor antagonist
MALHISEREQEGVVILDMKGRLTTGEATPLREKITQVLADGKKNIILNLEKIDYIDSTGLGGMVICFTQVQKAGGALKLTNLNRRNVELLALTRLHTVFQVFAEEQDAVNSYFPNREIKHFDILAFIKQNESEH